MDHQTLFNSFVALNPYERVGRDHLQAYGKPLNYGQFIYMYSQPKTNFTLEGITTSEAVAQQAALRQRFRSDFGAKLTEDAFFKDGRNIELEQLLRFVDLAPHRHDFLECSFVLSGSCNHIVAEHSYIQEAGNCAIIVPGIEHRLLPTPDCVCLTIKIKKQTFSNMDIPNLPSFAYPISFDCGRDPFVLHTLLTIYEQQTDDLPYSDRIIEQLFQTLMTYIIQKYRDTMTYLAPQAIADPRILEIMNYIFENFQTISLNSLAEHFHFNPSYLSQVIRHETGASFVEILRDFRLKHAARLLEETAMPLNDICDAIGYKDSSQFIRNFKDAYHSTPIKYRREKAHK